MYAYHTFQTAVDRAVEMAVASGNYKSVVYHEKAAEFWVLGHPHSEAAFKDSPVVYIITPEGTKIAPNGGKDL